jgi:hypothetical protein
VGSWAVQGSWATFRGEKMALHGVALKKMAIHGVNWHFSELLHLVRSFFHWGQLSFMMTLFSFFYEILLESQSLKKGWKSFLKKIFILKG